MYKEEYPSWEIMEGKAMGKR